MKSEEEDGYIWVCGAVDGHQLELVLIVTVEDGTDCIANLTQRRQWSGNLHATSRHVKATAIKLRLNVILQVFVLAKVFPRSQAVNVPLGPSPIVTRPCVVNAFFNNYSNLVRRLQ